MGRVPYSDIDGGILMDALGIFSILIFSYGMYLLFRKSYTGTIRFDDVMDLFKGKLEVCRIRDLLWLGLLGSRIYRKFLDGLFHTLLFAGMAFLFVGTILVFCNVLFGLPVMSGPFYHWGMAFLLDVAGTMALIGVTYFLVRRLFRHPRLAEPKFRKGFLSGGVLLFAVLMTGFFVEGLRLRITDSREMAFLGYWIAQLLRPIPFTKELYVVLWWIHGILALFFISYVPFSPFVHLFSVPVNTALFDGHLGADTKAFDATAFENARNEEIPAIGSAAISDFSYRRHLDFHSCVWCGRCQEVCPTAQTQKNLTPKGVMVTLSEWLRNGKSRDKGLIDAVGVEAIFECRTCAACAEICPAAVNPLKAIWNMRQHLVMERGEMPQKLIHVHRNLEALQHPFSSSSEVQAWKKGMSVPPFVAKETEFLLWIGCAVTYEDRAQQIGRAVVELFNGCGISYGVIEDARCTGDPAKQIGDDHLFSILARSNIERFETLQVKKIVTICPHCYNSFKNYYPALGGHYEVLSHTTLIRELIRAGKITVEAGEKRIAYHDPCYLGRHNRVFEDPREVIQSMGSLVELPRHRKESFCCGAGGGNYWNEEKGSRINYARAREAYQSDADLVAAACPFCLLMLSDGLKMHSERKIVYDIAELVLQARKAVRVNDGAG